MGDFFWREPKPRKSRTLSLFAPAPKPDFSSIMQPQTGPAMAASRDPYRMILPRDYKFPNRLGGQGAYAAPAGDSPLRRLQRPSTIAPLGQSPMTQPLRQQDLGGLNAEQYADMYMVSAPSDDPYDTPYYNARRARNAMGQGSPVAPMGQFLRQGQGAYVGMAPGSMAPAAQSPLQRMAMTQQPSMNPMPAQGPGPLARMGINNPNRQFGGAGRSPFPTGSDAELRSVLPVNREDRLARVNQLGQGGQTLEQAAADPNFNADGRFFQGAQLGMDQNGRAYFRERENRTFAGGVSNDSIAAGNRLRTLKEMEARGRGYVLPSGGFAGIGDGTAAIKTSPEQLADNRASYLQRMQQGRQQRMQNVTALAQQRAAERNLSPLQRMMASDPRFLAMQQQQAHQLAMQELQNRGGLAEANARGQAAQEEMRLRGIAALAANGDADARRHLGLPVAAQPADQFVVNPGKEAGLAADSFTKLQEFAKNATAKQVSEKLTELGITDREKHNMMLNKLKPGLFGMTQRTMQDPEGWDNAFNDTVVDPETGKEIQAGYLRRLFGFAKPTGYMGAKPQMPLWMRTVGRLTGG